MMYKFWLLSVDGISQGIKRKLSTYFCDAYHVYNASEKQLKDSYILKDFQIEIINNSKAKWNLEEALESFLQGPYSFITVEDDAFPKKLLRLNDCPYGIFYLGSLECLKNKTVGMVGARSCSAYGKNTAYQIAKGLAEFDVTVISGMAKGIDSFSHNGALDGKGKTCAVLGCGIDTIYPAENKLLYEKIALSGCVISEFPMGNKPQPKQFPGRNRIISVLSDAVIVVEAKKKSGSLITADFALEQGIDLYAVPGRLGDSLSEGCINLIKDGAYIFSSVLELLEDINHQQIPTKKLIVKEEENYFNLENNDLLVYSGLDFYPKGLDEIVSNVQLDFFLVLESLMHLIDIGIAAETFKNQYIRLR